MNYGSTEQKRITAMAGALLALCACMRENSATAQSSEEIADAAEKRDPLDTGIHRYSVYIPVTICPRSSDLHERIDQLILGKADLDPPPQCRSLPVGSVLLMELPGHRPSSQYRQFAIEQAMLPDGTVVWSDELGAANVELIGSAAR